MTRPVDLDPIRVLKPADRPRYRLPDEEIEWRRYLRRQMAATLPKSLAEDLLYEPSLDPAPRGWAWRELLILAALGLASLLALAAFVAALLFALVLFGAALDLLPRRF